LAFNHLPVLVRLGRIARQFWTSEVRGKATILAALLVVILLGIVALNVVNSYVGRAFMSSLAERRPQAFWSYALLYVGVFLAASIVATLERYVEQSLGLTMRAWLTGMLVDGYLDCRAYLNLQGRADVANPDQRITEDARQFSTIVLSFCILLFNGTVTAISFSVVLWSISPTLLGACVGYALLGSAVTVLLGKPLIGLNYKQLDREANFRAALVHIRENAGAIALSQAEMPLRRRLALLFGDLVENFRSIIGVNVRLNLSTNLYNYLPQIIPILIVGPLFIRGEVEFGVVTQSMMAFTLLIGALSLLVTQFQDVSTFTAEVARLGELIDVVKASCVAPLGGIDMIETPDRVAFTGVSLISPVEERLLVRDLTMAVEREGRLLITGPNEDGKLALFQTVAGLWRAGQGRVQRPPLGEIQFVPQRPYVVPGTLRAQFQAAPAAADDGKVQAALETVGLGDLPRRAGGLDTDKEWSNMLGLAEQQRLALARVLLARPRFAFLDGLDTTLGREATEEMLGRLASARVGYVTFAENDELGQSHDTILELDAQGGWKVRSEHRGSVAGR
jgi:putative ATP-binding cassette transporter